MNQNSLRTRLELGTFPRILGAALTTRLVLDTSTQIFNPFLSIIAAGLGIDTITLGRLISLRSIMGVVAPVFGSLADRVGYRVILRFGLLLAAAGQFTIGSSTNVWMVIAGMLLSGIGISGFVPTLQAYISSLLPYERRAQGIGVLEYAWALSGIVGLYLVGLLIAAAGWRAPFFVLGSGMLVAWFVFALLPSARQKTGSPSDSAQIGQILQGTAADWRRWPGMVAEFFRLGENSTSAWANLMVSGLIMFASLHVIITHGAWLNQEYGLGPASLGVVALVSGIGDLCGSVLVSLVTDRIGKRRSVLLGTAATIVAYLLLPIVNVGLVVAVAGITLVRFSFEFTIVSNLSLMSEQMPDKRGKIMTLSATFGLVGATLAGITGPWSYARFGVWGLGIFSGSLALIALTVLLRWVKDPGGRQPVIVEAFTEPED